MTFEKKNLPLKIIISCIAFGFIVAALPFVQSFAIMAAERYLGRSLSEPESWKEIWRHCAFMGFLIFATVWFLLFTDYGKKVRSEISFQNKALFKSVQEREGQGLFPFFTIIFICAFFYFCFFKVVDADFVYSDDVFHKFSGNRSWIGFGHYFAEFSSILFHTSIEIEDAAPLIQFLSIFVMGASTIVLCYVLVGRVKIFPLLLISITFISPYYAECFTYRYDSLYMTLSIFFAALPFLYRKNELTFAFSSFVFLMLSLMSYQAGTSVYILTTIFLAYSEIQKEDNLKNPAPYRFALVAAASFAVTLLFYFFAFANQHSMEGTGYFDAGFGFSHIVQNFKTYFSFVFPYYGGKWTKFFFALVLLLALVLLSKNSRQKKIVSVILTVAAILLCLLLSYGSYIVFPLPPFTWRSFMGFSFFVSLLAMGIYNACPNKAAQVPSALLIYGLVVFLYTYGTCLSDQRRYDAYRDGILLNDLSRFTREGVVNKIRLSGSYGHPRTFDIPSKNFPVIPLLIPTHPRSPGVSWNEYYFDFFNFECDEVDIPQDHGLPLLVSTRYHDIYGRGEEFYVVAKE